MASGAVPVLGRLIIARAITTAARMERAATRTARRLSEGRRTVASDVVLGGTTMVDLLTGLWPVGVLGSSTVPTMPAADFTAPTSR